jgi:hypothetical protein
VVVKRHDLTTFRKSAAPPAAGTVPAGAVPAGGPVVPLPNAGG